SGFVGSHELIRASLKMLIDALEYRIMRMDHLGVIGTLLARFALGSLKLTTLKKPVMLFRWVWMVKRSCQRSLAASFRRSGESIHNRSVGSVHKSTMCLADNLATASSR